MVYQLLGQERISDLVFFLFLFCFCSLAGPSIYSDVFPVRYADASSSEAACRNWLEQSRQKRPTVTGHCPCTLRQAVSDTAQYTQDPFCTENSDWLPNCRYRSKFAVQCIMPNYLRYASSLFAFMIKYMKITEGILHML